MFIVLSLLIVVAGLVIGSFLNVVIYRLPRGESLWNPPSHCPVCGARILWYDNVPLLSFLLLAGRCRSCKKPISPRYPLVEGMCAAFFLLVLFRHLPFVFNPPFLLSFIKDLLFVSILIPVFFIDVEHQIIPDSLSYGMLGIGLFLSGLQGNFLSSLTGAGAGAGIFLLIFYLSLVFLHQPGMGMGDVKLAAGIGAFLGLEAALLSFFLSFLSGALVAGILVFFHLKRMKDKIPFGPFLVAGAFITLFLGKNILELYFTLFW